MIGTTHKQAKLLDFIGWYQRENGGVSPSFEDMKAAVDLKSKSGIHRLITALEERGLIRRLPNRARALEIVPSDNQLARFTNRQLINELARRGERARAA